MCEVCGADVEKSVYTVKEGWRHFCRRHVPRTSGATHYEQAFAGLAASWPGPTGGK